MFLYTRQAVVLQCKLIRNCDKVDSWWFFTYCLCSTVKYLNNVNFRGLRKPLVQKFEFVCVKCCCVHCVMLTEPNLVKFDKQIWSVSMFELRTHYLLIFQKCGFWGKCPPKPTLM
jgi:hypothetical protein